MNYKQTRSQSCPDVILFSCKSPILRRKRALSENLFNDERFGDELEQTTLQIQSRHSETNLMRIDKQKTFKQQSVLENTGELLAQVVFALNGFNPNADEMNGAAPGAGGIDLFSDVSILEDEWSIITTPSDQSNSKPSKKQRSRAKSLYQQTSKSTNNADSNTPQLTWSGNNIDIQEFVNEQVNYEKKSKNMPKKDTNGVVISIDKPKEPDSSTNRRKSVFTAFNNVFKRRNTIFSPSVETPVEQIDPTSPPIKTSISPVLEVKFPIKTDINKADLSKKLQINGELKRRQSILSNQSTSSEQVLGNTTIADLIRAIESAHVKNMLGSKTLESLSNRRVSLLPPRRGSVSFSSPLETPPSAGPKSFNLRKSSMAAPRNRILTMRQNSSPTRFSVTPVADSPSSAVSLSPIIQRRMRRFSAIPATTMMPPRKMSSSLHATPLAMRRAQFKQTISPLAMPPTPEAPNDTPQLKNAKQSIAALSKSLSKTLESSKQNV